MKKTFLAGDIGGTHARFALLEVSQRGAPPELIHHDALESGAFKTFEAALREFLASAPASSTRARKVEAATFGIAGPIVDQRVKTTNLPWTIDARKVSRTFGIAHVTLLNDLVAAGLGAIASPPKRQAVVFRGRPKRSGGNLAVLAAGTGLGEASFFWDGTEHLACATEGSHVEFAPRTAVEDELLAWLRPKFGHVSYERVASGSTLHTLYDFFVSVRRVRERKEAVALVAEAEDPNVAVVELALSGASEAAMQAVDLWSSVYGAEAGNLVLKSLATGGVYLCGGLSVRLASVLARGLPNRRASKESPFVEAFLDKGRMRPLLESVPVAVCLEPSAGLFGAATHVASQQGKTSKRRA
jgi:glucokinase